MKHEFSEGLVVSYSLPPVAHYGLFNKSECCIKVAALQQTLERPQIQVCMFAVAVYMYFTNCNQSYLSCQVRFN